MFTFERQSPLEAKVIRAGQDEEVESLEKSGRNEGLPFTSHEFYCDVKI